MHWTKRVRSARVWLGGTICLIVLAGTVVLALDLSRPSSLASAGTVLGYCTKGMPAKKCQEVRNAANHGLSVRTGQQSSPTVPSSTSAPASSTVDCGVTFFSPAEAAELNARFGGYSCEQAANGSGWVIVANGMSETAPTFSSTPGGSMVAIENCTASDSTCLDPNATHTFGDFTVYYPPDPSGFPLKIWTEVGSNLLALDNPPCGMYLFNMSTGDWYPGTDEVEAELLAGQSPSSSPAPEPVPGSVAISAASPPAATCS